MNKWTEYNTRKAAELAAENAGLTGEAAELAARVGGPARHERRVQAAVTAATEWGTDVGRSRPYVKNTYACMALVLDRVGAFGPFGLGNPGGCSARHPAFRDLGSGRRHANDGGAWDAAIRAADEWLHPEEYRALRLTPLSGDGVDVGAQFVKFGGHENAELTETPVVVFCPEPSELRFFAALVGRCLATSYDLLHEYRVFAVTSDEAWGSLYNRVLVRLEEEV